MDKHSTLFVKMAAGVYCVNCKFPGCIRPQYYDETRGLLFDFCGKTHAEEYRKLEVRRPVTSTTGKFTENLIVYVCTFTNACM